VQPLLSHFGHLLQERIDSELLLASLSVYESRLRRHRHHHNHTGLQQITSQQQVGTKRSLHNYPGKESLLF